VSAVLIWNIKGILYTNVVIIIIIALEAGIFRTTSVELSDATQAHWDCMAGGEFNPQPPECAVSCYRTLQRSTNPRDTLRL
jgi:hypothetical protein